MIDEREALERTLKHFPAEPVVVERVYRRRRRKQRNQRIAAGVVGLALTSVAILAGSTVLRSSQRQLHPQIVPTPSPVLVTPLCEHPDYQYLLPAPYNGKGNCPLATPAGRYASALLGVHLLWPFTFTLPDGWGVAGIPRGNGLDLRKRGADVGISIIVYPQGSKGSVVEGSRALANWVSQRSDVVASPVTQIEFDGDRAWEVDVRPREDAPTISDCRVGTMCAPLLRPMWGSNGVYMGPLATAVALLPHTTSRLIFFGGRGLSSVVWIWDTAGGPGTTESQQVVDSLRFEAHLSG